MQVLCKSTEGNAETECPVCRLGFIMFWERQSRSERREGLRELHKMLIAHHRTSPGPEAHPKNCFPVPEPKNFAAFHSELAFGHAPSWAI